ncbi:hypothetical protein GUJ93_ZPchr0005g15621 [Zizania palustris]|uniref:Uncharacterized protein n=1 Tax=Zizania palustris TaxID=103762 RepID=A0A8J5W1Y0_ZIZPA|nr:hypothetical protein GUJ93_ZPchr0005g15621 [Zizania palustris]
MENKKQWHNTSVDDGAGLGGRRRGACRTAGRGSADGGAEVGARPTAVWGFDLGGEGLGTRRTAFLGDSVLQTAAQRSELGLWRVWGSDLGGARPGRRRRRARNSVDGVPGRQRSADGGAGLRGWQREARRTAVRGALWSPGSLGDGESVLWKRGGARLMRLRDFTGWVMGRRGEWGG